MQCDTCQDVLFDYADNRLTPPRREAVTQHLDECESCRAACEDILHMRAQANVWMDEAVPAWSPPRLPRRDLSELIQRWFPTLASTAALALVAVMFIQQDNRSQQFIEQAPLNTASFTPSPAVRSELVRTVVDTTRSQRQQELEALVKLLKAEMDRRSLETEESLRYLIAHQIQGQQDLDALYERVDRITPTTREGSQ